MLVEIPRLTMLLKPVVGKGPFQWNAGGWAGMDFGGTAWMLVMSGFLIAYGELRMAAVPVVTAVISIGIGWALWNRRDRLDPFVAMQSMLAVLAITTVVAWWAAGFCGSPVVISAMRFPDSQWWIVAFVPAHMVWFAIQQRLAARAARCPEFQPDP
jgi:hypothetical protein